MPNLNSVAGAGVSHPGRAVSSSSLDSQALECRQEPCLRVSGERCGRGLLALGWPQSISLLEISVPCYG